MNMVDTQAESEPPHSGTESLIASKLETFSYDDQIVRMFALATLVWGLVGTLAGLIVAILLVAPQFTFTEYVSFGRLRPLHTNAAIFAFAGNAIFAAVYYSTQRLCKARMWSDMLGRLHLGLAADHRFRCHHVAAGNYAKQRIRGTRMANRHRDRIGLGRILRSQLFHDVGQTP